MKIDIKYIIGFIGAITLIMVGVVLFDNPQTAKGSIQDGQGYNSTTTSSYFGTTWVDPKLVRTGGGILGSVVITKQTQTTTLNLYDATTTNVNLRTGQLATSTILLASFGTSTPVGTYVLDTVFTNGLIIDPTPIGGAMVASSTVTWK